MKSTTIEYSTPELEELPQLNEAVQGFSEPAPPFA